MRESVYFYDGSKSEKCLAIGQLLVNAHACGIKGKELGYNKVYMEWKNKNSFRWFDDGTRWGDIKCPKNTVLPIEFVEEETELLDTDLIDISKPNMFFDCSNPLIYTDKASAVGGEEYLRYYWNKTGKYPNLDLNRTIKPYVLLHYRFSEQQKQQFRNVPDEWYIKMIDLIRKYCPNLSLYKTGEKCSFEDKFDKIFGYFPRDIDRMFRLFSESKLHVGIPSGPWAIPNMGMNPMLIMCHDPQFEITMHLPWFIKETQYIFSPEKDKYENKVIDILRKINE
jgi:hypothetical protein